MDGNVAQSPASTADIFLMDKNNNGHVRLTYHDFVTLMEECLQNEDAHAAPHNGTTLLNETESLNGTDLLTITERLNNITLSNGTTTTSLNDTESFNPAEFLKTQQLLNSVDSQTDTGFFNGTEFVNATKFLNNTEFLNGTESVNLTEFRREFHKDTHWQLCNGLIRLIDKDWNENQTINDTLTRTWDKLKRLSDEGKLESELGLNQASDTNGVLVRTGLVTVVGVAAVILAFQLLKCCRQNTRRIDGRTFRSL